MSDKEQDDLARRVEQQVKRMQRAEHDRPTLLAQTVYLGSLGLVFIVPVVICAYLGNWLDHKLVGFSVHWTISLIFIGIAIGAFNVYRMIRSHE